MAQVDEAVQLEELVKQKYPELYADQRWTAEQAALAVQVQVVRNLAIIADALEKRPAPPSDTAIGMANRVKAYFGHKRPTAECDADRAVWDYAERVLAEQR